MTTRCLDANIILRYLEADNPKLSPLAREIIVNAESGQIKLYLDEVTVAEVVWTLSSYYNHTHQDIVDKLLTFLSPNWVTIGQKRLVIEALKLFRDLNLSYIDCWLLAVCHKRKITLQSFDEKLLKLHKKYPQT